MIKHVAVIGAGTMGNGIAHLFAQFGFSVQLIDLDARQLEKARATISSNLDRQISKGVLSEAAKATILSNIIAATDLAHGVQQAELVIEAATENEDLKKQIFKQVDAHTKPSCILATNTSSISISLLASETNKPANVIGMHFMNPVPVMQLVEVINGNKTSGATTKTVVDLSRQMGKVPCVVNDYPGFVANRILMPMINEAITCLQDGVSGVEEIDTIMKLGMAHPMGPLQLADFIGLDVCVAILNVLYDGLKQPHYQPCALLLELVRNKTLGKKTGEGFYVYAAGSKEIKVSPRFLKPADSN